MPEIVEALEKTLNMPKPNWNEEIKAELKRHFEGIANLILEEYQKLQMNKRVA